MPGRGVQGLSEFYHELDEIPSAARFELADKMGKIGRDLLAAQHQDVPKATGALDGALSLQLITDRLKLKVGLLTGGRDGYRFNGRSRRELAGGPFYGRIVEFGRKTQTVLVTRRVQQRRVKGNGRNGTQRRVIYGGASDRLRRRGPNKGTAIGSPYKMRVKFKGGRPFVAQPDLQQIADRQLSNFWVDVLGRTGAA